MEVGCLSHSRFNSRNPMVFRFGKVQDKRIQSVGDPGGCKRVWGDEIHGKCVG